MNWQDLSGSDIAREVARDFPAHLSAIVDFNPSHMHGNEGNPCFEFTALAQSGAEAFNCTVSLSFNEKSARLSFVESHPEVSLHKGLGVKFLVNLTNFLRKIDIDVLRIFAGEDGGYVWAACGAYLDWNDDSSREENTDFKNDCQNYMRFFQGQDLQLQQFLQNWVDGLSTDNAFGFSELIDCAMPLKEDAYLFQHYLYVPLLKKIGQGNMTPAALLLDSMTWAGYFNVHDEKQMTRLHDYAAMKFRPV